MIIIDLIPQALEIGSNVIVNKTMRGNMLLLYPTVMFPTMWTTFTLNYRRQKWLELTSEEQIARQYRAILEGRNEHYPL